jgi:hypothetical protein
MVVHFYDGKGVLLCYTELTPGTDFGVDHFEATLSPEQAALITAGNLANPDDHVIIVIYDGDTGERVTPFGMGPLHLDPS